MRISDWSSDVCSSDLDSFARQSFLSCGGSSERRSRNAKPNERKPDPGFVPENGDYKTRRHGEDGERHDTQTSRVNGPRSEEHTSELQSLMRISYAVFCLTKKNKQHTHIYKTKHQKNYQ